MNTIVCKVISYLNLRDTNKTIIQPKNYESRNIFEKQYLQIKHKEVNLITMGLVNKKLLNHFAISQDVVYTNIEWHNILSINPREVQYKKISKFPEVSRDLSLILEAKTSYNEIEEVIKSISEKRICLLTLIDIYKSERLGSNKKTYTINIRLQDQKKTLTEKDIDKIMNRLINEFEDKLNAQIRKN